jgi:uncharacterized protein
VRVVYALAAGTHHARNTGTGEPPQTATTLKPAAQEIHHDLEHPSAVILPVKAADPNPWPD